MINIKRDPRLKRGTAQGQMAFWDATLGKWTYTETSEVLWDDVNKRVGIGTDSPSEKLEVVGNILASGTGTFGGTSSGISTIASGLTVNEDGGNGANDDFRVKTAGFASALLIDASENNIFIGVPFKAGTAVAGTAPIKLTSGVVNTTPESGAIEFDGSSYYLTV